MTASAIDRYSIAFSSKNRVVLKACFQSQSSALRIAVLLVLQHLANVGKVGEIIHIAVSEVT